MLPDIQGSSHNTAMVLNSQHLHGPAVHRFYEAGLFEGQ